MGPWTTSRCQDGTSRLSTSSQYLIAVTHLPWFSLLTQRPSIHSPPDNHRLCHWWDSSNARHYCCYQTEFWLCSSSVILLKASFFKFDISAEKNVRLRNANFGKIIFLCGGGALEFNAYTSTVYSLLWETPVSVRLKQLANGYIFNVLPARDPSILNYLATSKKWLEFSSQNQFLGWRSQTKGTVHHWY